MKSGTGSSVPPRRHPAHTESARHASASLVQPAGTSRASAGAGAVGALVGACGAIDYR